MKVLAQLFIPEQLFVMVFKILGCGNEESAGAACRIAYDIRGCWFSKFNHHLDNVSWGTELSVFTRRRNFG